MAAAASFLPAHGPVPKTLRAALELDGKARVVELRQGDGGVVTVSAAPPARLHRLGQVARWVIAARLDLKPFYAVAAADPIMSAMAADLGGLKPLRPATLLEMAVIAITEQQLSLAAAFHIRTRLVERFGSRFEGLWLFPRAHDLAGAAPQDLRACGLSGAKARAVKALAMRMAEGELSFGTLDRLSDGEIRDVLLALPGVGPWSAEYILLRGFGRPDSLPVGDVGLQRSVGTALLGRRLSAEELEQALERFRPFRGLAAFYASVHVRLFPGRRAPSRSRA